MKRFLLFLFIVLPICQGWAQPTCSTSFKFNAPFEVCTGSTVPFTASGPAGVNFTTAWDFGDGATATGNSVSHIYTVQKFYTVKATVTVLTTSGGFPAGYTCTSNVSVDAETPYIMPTVSCVGNATQFIILGGVVGRVSGTINFGDNQSATLDSNGSAQHIYAVKGTYTVSASIIITPLFSFGQPCSLVISDTVFIPSCDVFACENRDFETGSFDRWTFYTDPCAPNGFCSLINGPVKGNHDIVSGNGVDPYGGFPVVAPGGNYSLKIGNDKDTDKNAYNANYFTMKVTPENAFFAYRVAVVLENTDIPTDSLPYVSMDIGLNFQEASVSCASYFITNSNGGFQKVPGKNVYYLPWTTVYVDLSPYIGEEVNINLYVAKGNYVDLANETFKNLFAYAYFDTYCSPPFIQTAGNNCIGSPIQFAANFDSSIPGETITWDMGNGNTFVNGKNLSYTYSSANTYPVTVTYDPHLSPDSGPLRSSFQTGCGIMTLTKSVSVTECAPPFVCETCIPSFSPLPGQKYILNAWVKEGDGIGAHTYQNVSIRVNFAQGTVTGDMKPEGLIIDGWQRIEGVFTVPDDAKEVWIELHNDTDSVEAFFDDIRVQPFNASMKAFVYDPVTLRMVSELDERNYATFYEYDEEGALVRVKKETERGVKTVRETRESIRKRGQ